MDFKNDPLSTASPSASSAGEKKAPTPAPVYVVAAPSIPVEPAVAVVSDQTASHLIERHKKIGNIDEKHETQIADFHKKAAEAVPDGTRGETVGHPKGTGLRMDATGKIIAEVDSGGRVYPAHRDAHTVRQAAMIVPGISTPLIPGDLDEDLDPGFEEEGGKGKWLPEDKKKAAVV